MPSENESRSVMSDPDYIVHGILQARIVDWLAIPFARGSSQPRDQTQVSRIAGRLFTSWAAREAHDDSNIFNKLWHKSWISVIDFLF